MGIRHLDSFIRENVPGGYFRVNIEDEIRKYFDTASTPNPPAPIIVIDLISLYTPLSKHDEKGLPFGGRFNWAYAVIDELFGKLKKLGAKLEFFYDGPVPESKSETWCGRQDQRYGQMLQLIDAVDRGMDVDRLLNSYSPPLNFQYPVRYLAKKYGQFKMAISRECDQELASYATKVKALAIISNDSDFLIYEGSWKYWSSQQLDLSTLHTMEYNRAALVAHLNLSVKQMPLFATLCGNDIMPYDTVKFLHYQLGQNRDKFRNVAQYIRRLPGVSLDKAGVINILRKIAHGGAVDNDLVQRFQLSLDTYSVDIPPQNANPTEDPELEALIQQESSLTFLIWHEKPVDVAIGLVDMRRNDFGRDFGQLQASLIVRMAGIILFHRKPQRPAQCEIIIKMSHQSPHQTHSFPIEYPSDVESPALLELLSKDPVSCEDLQDVKFQLVAWIASDTLKPDKLQPVPHQLRMTVFTVYYLLEKKVLELFEADLLLQVAHDVTFETYDFRAISYPRTIESRPFRLIFLYQKIYALTAKAFRLVGLDNEDDFRDDPPFDGVLFHKRYDQWRQGRGELEHIKEWRIYEALAAEDDLKK